jgi:hypothetical protein
MAGDGSILYVMAVDAEYGPHLRKRISPLMTGVGPVEAGVVLSATLARKQAAGQLPSLVVSLVRRAAARWSRPASIRRRPCPTATWTPRRLGSRRVRRRSSICLLSFRCRLSFPEFRALPCPLGKRGGRRHHCHLTAVSARQGGRVAEVDSGDPASRRAGRIEARYRHKIGAERFAALMDALRALDAKH